tara:strand:- start:4137 stop:4586 length:450 start_codon:yes stop_codon:yes gene_type:complete
MSYTKVTYGLGSLGLIPFVAGLILSARQHDIIDISGESIFITYSLAILCFLAGVVWGQVLKVPSSHAHQRILIITNILVVIGWAAVLTSQKFYVLSVTVLTLGFVGVFFLEFTLFKLSTTRQDRQYARLRVILTGLVIAVHSGMLVIHV